MEGSHNRRDQLRRWLGMRATRLVGMQATAALLTSVCIQPGFISPTSTTASHGPAAARSARRTRITRVCIQLRIARDRVVCYRGHRRRRPTEGERSRALASGERVLNGRV